MKILTIFAAGLVAVTGLAAVPATAQQGTVVRERTVITPARTNTRVVVREHSGTRTRNAYAYGHRRHRVCTVRYRHGERIRTCRHARY